jgi:hypothetical protein
LWKIEIHVPGFCSLVVPRSFISGLSILFKKTFTFLVAAENFPLYLGTVIVFWATPQMTLGLLLFALGMTLYTLIGIKFEEQDMITLYGKEYEQYMQTVGMLIPRIK